MSFSTSIGVLFGERGSFVVACVDVAESKISGNRPAKRRPSGTGVGDEGVVTPDTDPRYVTLGREMLVREIR
jgi:hypothetical protein